MESVKYENLEISDDSYYSTSLISSTTIPQDGQQSEQPIITLPGRPAFTKEAFDANYQLITPGKKSFTDELKHINRRNCCNTHCLWNFVKGRFPILVWLPKYEWKNDFARDLIAGITIAVLHISLGMAFALLAFMPPITGMYIAFFSNLIYTFVGGCHNIALCGTALISIMVGEVVEKFLHPIDTPIAPKFEDVDSVTIATSVTMLAGLFQIVTGSLRMGGLTVYLSDTMLSGFLCGSAVHVLSSQLAPLIGVGISQVSSPLKVFKIFVSVVTKLPVANVATVIISIITLVFLLLGKFLSARFLTVVPFPIPLELFVILLGTFISYFMELARVYRVAIVGDIPTGLPPLDIPDFSIMPNLLLDSFVICVVSYTVTLSLGMYYAKKYNYEISSNQELVSLGFINIVGSFFQCVPAGVGMSRTLAQEAAGGRNLMTNFVSAVALFFAILFIGPVFYCLPSCILSMIAVIALKGMVSQVKILRATWSVSILEASIWIVAFLAVILLDVGIGLGIGFFYSLMVVVVRTQWPYTSLLGKVVDSDMYLDVKKYQTAKEIPGILIYHFASFLYFVNKSYFKSELNRYVSKKSSDYRDGSSSSTKSKQFWATESFQTEDLLLVDNDRDSSTYGTLSTEVPSIHHIIIDASGWSYIDMTGIDTLSEVVDEYKVKGITVFIAGCQVQVIEKIAKSEFYQRGSKHLIFPSIQDAIAYAELSESDL
ncbi:hypothetical protein CHUAL_005349 [Chamberlinius hualienensis]